MTQTAQSTTTIEETFEDGIPNDVSMPDECGKYRNNDNRSFTRPDRQIGYPNIPPAEWPELVQDTNTLYVDRVKESGDGPHRFLIKKGDSVRVWLGGDRFDTGKALALSAKNNTVKILWKSDSKPQWFSKSKIYPAFPTEQFGTSDAAEPNYEAPMAGSTICSLMSANKVSIEELSKRLNVPEQHVRDVREHGLPDDKAIREWVVAISGRDVSAKPPSEPSANSPNGAATPDSDRQNKQKETLALVKDSIGELNEALKLGKSDTLVRYLDFLSRFHNYSLLNSMLIYLQRPDATHVAGFNRWKQMKRFVKKGEKGINIIAPIIRKTEDESETVVDGDKKVVQKVAGFRVAKVFDVSQTDGGELPAFPTLVGEPGDGLRRLEQLVTAKGIELFYDHLGPGIQGVSTGGAITVNPDLTEGEKFAVLVHEFAHELLHKGDRKNETTKTVRETEAEAVAYVVCKACGIDSTQRSSDYIQLYRGDSVVLEESLDFIQKVATDIISGLKVEPKGE